MIPSKYQGVWAFYSNEAIHGGRDALAAADGGESYTEYMKYYNQPEAFSTIGKYNFEDLIFAHVPHANDPSILPGERDVVITGNGDLGLGNYRDNWMVLQRDAQRTRTPNDDRASTMYGFRGNDVLTGNEFPNGLYGADRTHLYEGFYSDGASDKDLLGGGGGEDKLYGAGDNDVLRGGHDDDDLFGGEGNDIIFGEQNEDNIYGLEGDDILVGGLGNDVMFGGPGNDIFAFGYNPLEHYDKDVIVDFGDLTAGGSTDVVMFNKPLSELGISVEADYDNNLINFKSEITNKVILEVRASTYYVAEFTHGIISQPVGDGGDFGMLTGGPGYEWNYPMELVDEAVQGFLA